MMSATREPTVVDGAVVLLQQQSGRSWATVLTGDRYHAIEFKNKDGAFYFDDRILNERVNNRPNGWLNTYRSLMDQPLAGIKGFRRGSDPYRHWAGYVEETLTRLWDSLLGPLDVFLRSDTVKLMPQSSVVLVPQGPLDLLPLSAALDRGSGQTFAERWAVSLVSSHKSLTRCREQSRKADARDQRLLGIIDPDGTLPGAAFEAVELERLFDGIERRFLRHDQATLEAVLCDLNWPTHLHISAHGHHDFDRPLTSGIILAKGDRLTIGNVRHAEGGDLRLAYLSGCLTGLPTAQALPDTLKSPALAFASWGAGAVIATLWPVFDDAAYLVATRFYEELLGRQEFHGQAEGTKRPPPEAMQMAQHWLRTVTFGELRGMFVEEAGSLLIGQPHRQAGGHDASFAVDALAQGLVLSLRAPAGSGVPGQGILLPLGDDNACPYASPAEWAAFTVTGA